MSTILIDPAHAEKILRNLLQQCNNEELCDVVLITSNNEKRISAHRCILSSASDYFNNIFSSSACKSTTDKELKLEVHGDTLENLIKYCYTGRMVIREKYIVEQFEVAYMLGLSDVVTECANFLEGRLSPSKCLGYAILAERCDCQSLLVKATDFCVEHFMEVNKCNEFLKLNANQLCQLLARKDLCVATDEDVFKSIKTWLEHDPFEREQYKAEVLKLARLPFLNRIFLMENVKPICNSEECRQLYIEAIEYQFRPGNNRNLAKNCPIRMKKSNEFLLAITKSKTNGRRMNICYFCPHWCYWMRWIKDLEYRCDFGVAVLKDCLYIVGGCSVDNIVLNSVICLHLKTMTFRKINSMNHARAKCRAVTLNGFLYAVGGCNKNETFGSVEKWDSITNQWKEVASMKTKRFYFGMAVLNESLYVVGGLCAKGAALASAELYEPIKNVWKPIAPMRRCRQLPGIATAKGLLYVIGGFRSKSIERYDPASNSWTNIRLLSEYARSESCTTFRDNVIVCYDDRVEVYNDATKEWEQSSNLKGLDNVICICSHSNNISTAEFTEIN